MQQGTGSLALAGVLAIAAAGLAACTALGPPYEEAAGSNVATVRAAWQDGGVRKDGKVRILQVDGRRVSPLLPPVLSVGGGVRQIGVEASAGGASVFHCVTFFADDSQRYLIGVAGPERDWALSVTNEDVKEKVAVLKAVRAKDSCPASR